ncbi:MAG: FAD-dependent oxidoreductase [Acidobacteriota bacterium]
MSTFSRRTFLGSTGAVGIGSLAPAQKTAGGAPQTAVKAIPLKRPTLPVLRNPDAVVAGGSFAGVAAALELARAGRKVLLVEPRTYLGREVTATLRPWVAKRDPLPAIIQACTGAKNPEQYPNPSTVTNKVTEVAQLEPGEIPLKLDKVKLSLEDLLLAAGVELLYASFPVGVCLEGKEITGLIVGNKSGRQVLACRMIVDATETAVVARLAGAAFEPASAPAVRFSRTIEFEGVLPIQERTLAVPAKIGIAGNQVMVHHGYRGEAHVLVECPLAFQVQEFEPAEGMRREIEARKRTMQVASHLVNQAPAFQKALLAAASYELHGPHTSRMRGPEPQWARGLGWLELPEAGRAPLAAFAGPVKGLWCFEAARLKAAQAALFRDPLTAALAGEAFGRPAVARWDAMASKGRATAAPVNAASAAAEALEVKEQESPQRGRQYEQHPVASSEVPVLRTVDVLVVGGGTSGATAAAVAAREGVKTLLAEMNPGLGGTGTIAGVDSYWFGRRVGFAARVTEKVDEVHQSLRYVPEKSNTPRWNIEAKMFALLREAEQASAEVLFNTIVTGAVVQGAQVRGAVLATRYGPRAVLAKVVIDASGDGDVAAFAGAEFVYCSAMDHIGMWHTMAQFTNPGRNTNHFTSSVDVSNVEDCTRAVLAGRRRGNNCHDHGVYLASRETRHILGDSVVTMTDIYRHRRRPDVVNIHSSNSDMKGKTTSEWFLAGLIAPNYETEIPYGALLPKGLDNILVVGKAFSTTHDALAGIRQQADLENLGGVAALAAAKAVKENRTPRRIDVAELQQRLVKEGVLPSDTLARKLKSQRHSVAELKRLVEALTAAKPLLSYQDMPMFAVFRERIPFVEVCTAGPGIVPLLEAALESAQGEERVVIAQALAIHGSRAGVPTLVNEIQRMLAGFKKVPPRTTRILYIQKPPDQGAMPEPAYLLYSLGLARDKRGLPVWWQVTDILDPREEDFRDTLRGTFHYVDAICFGAERLGGPEAIPVLEKLHSYPTLREQVARKGFQPDYFQERQAMCELAIGKALSRSGSAKGYTIVIGYLEDNRVMLAEQAHSHLIRMTGRDCGKDIGAWNSWLEQAKGALRPQPLLEDLDIVYEKEILTA